MTWVETHAADIRRIRDYILEFHSSKPVPLGGFAPNPDPLFPMEAGSDRGAGLLLMFCALRQQVSDEKLAGFLGHLWRGYGPDIFRLNRLPFEGARESAEAFRGLAGWDLLPKVPGILRSVCDFFFRRGKVLPWIYSVGDAEECVRILAEEIFMMGKTSIFRGKPRRFLWLLTQVEGVDASRFWKADTMLAPTPGQARFLREFGPLKTRRTAPWNGPEAKLAYFNRFHNLLFPGKAWMASAGLDAYLEPDPDAKWLCRRILGGCEHCALAAECPGRVD